MCIDDFALRKRHNYGTIMIDIDTHRIVDILPSREIDDVAAWLRTYPNITIVSRDGSVSYNSSIKQANEEICQVSDRFHLIKGFTDAAKKFLTRFLAANFAIPTEASHYDRTQTSDYWDKAIHDDSPTREHKANLEKKLSIIERVKQLHKTGMNNGEIAEEVGINRVTVAKYLKPDYNPVNAMYNTTRKSKIKPYAQDIKQLLSEGKTFRQISEYIRDKGYDGADSTIRMYATRERKLMKEVDVSQVGGTEKIERKWLIKLLYKPLDKVKDLSREQLDRIIEKYPVIGRLYDTEKRFKETLFSKKPDKIKKWLKEVDLLDIDEINSFANGIRRDIDAVKNAIELDYNNGLAEGSVNKLKVIKRIMYGRSSFELLKSKLLWLELK